MVQGPLRTADAARRAAALPHYVSSVAPEDLDASVTYDLAWFQVLYRQRARCVAVRWGGRGREGGREGGGERGKEGERERGREGERERGRERDGVFRLRDPGTRGLVADQ